MSEIVRKPSLFFLPALVVLSLFVSTLVAETAKTPAPPEGDFAGRVQLRLPDTIYAVPGVEMNVYFQNVILVINPANYAFDVTCAKGIQQSERWTFTPTAKDVGSFPFKLEVLDVANHIIARASATLKVVRADAGKGQRVTMLCIGDSLTTGGTYTRRIIELAAKLGSPDLHLIGSVKSSSGTAKVENRHEGYGGWTAQRHATLYLPQARNGQRRNVGSPFVYKEGEGNPRLDFARYCKEFNGAQPPDFVTFLLGINDTFSAMDETIDSRIDVMFKHLDQLIAMIHGYGPATRIGLLLLVPPAASQDAFGANYRCGQTRWQFRRNQHRVIERTKKTYGGKESKNLWLVPAVVNLDTVHNFPLRTAPWNAHTKEKVTRLNNGVHPAAPGYYQIGDSIYCWMKAMVAEK